MCADECHQTFLPVCANKAGQPCCFFALRRDGERSQRTLGVLEVEELERSRLLERTLEVPQLAVDLKGGREGDGSGVSS